MTRLRHLRLSSPEMDVEVRLLNLQGRWIASVDTASGPTLGVGYLPYEAVTEALEPLGNAADDLLRALPDELYWPAG